MAAFFLSLREGLEVALIVSILLGALRRLDRGQLRRFVWLGVAVALAVSAVVAIGLVVAGIELEGQAEMLFEGVTLLLAAALLTGMIFWMQRQGGQFRAALDAGVRKAASGVFGANSSWALFAVAFIAVVREGIELALLLVATTLAGGAQDILAGALAGLGLAAFVGVLLYRGALHLNLKAFFRVTNILLLLFAAGMVGLGVHELVEASLMPAILDPIYDTNAFLSDRSTFGQLFKSLFGYDGNPALTETMAYVGYLGVVGWLILGRGHRQMTPRAA